MAIRLKIDHASVHVARFSIFPFGALVTESAPSSSMRNLLGAGSPVEIDLGGSSIARSIYSIRLIRSTAFNETCEMQEG